MAAAKPDNEWVILCGETKEGKSYMGNYLIRQWTAEGRIEYGKVLFNGHADGLEYLAGNHTTEVFYWVKLYNYLQFVLRNKKKGDENPPTLLYLADCHVNIPWAERFVKSWIGQNRHYGSVVMDCHNPGAAGGDLLRLVADKVYLFRTGQSSVIDNVWKMWFHQTSIGMAETEGMEERKRESERKKIFDKMALSLQPKSYEFICFDKTQLDAAGRPNVFRGKAPAFNHKEPLPWPNPHHLDLTPIQFRGNPLDQLKEGLPKSRRAEIEAQEAVPRRQRERSVARQELRRLVASDEEVEPTEEFIPEPVDRISSDGQTVYRRRYIPRSQVTQEELDNREPLMPPLDAAVMDPESELNNKIQDFITQCPKELEGFPFPKTRHWMDLDTQSRRDMLFDMRCDVQNYGQRPFHIRPLWNLAVEGIEKVGIHFGKPMQGYADAMRVDAPINALNEEVDRTIKQIELESDSILPTNPYARLASLAAASVAPYIRRPSKSSERVREALNKPASGQLASDLDNL